MRPPPSPHVAMYKVEVLVDAVIRGIRPTPLQGINGFVVAMRWARKGHNSVGDFGTYSVETLVHKTECILHHSLLNRALSTCRCFHALWRYYPL